MRCVLATTCFYVNVQDDDGDDEDGVARIRSPTGASQSRGISKKDLERVRRCATLRDAC